MDHPFLDDHLPISWHLLTPERADVDLAIALKAAQEEIDVLANRRPPYTFENVCLAFENAGEGLDRAWGRFDHLSSVCDSETLREVYKKWLPKVTDFDTQIYLNEKLWHLFQSYAVTDEAKALQGIRKRYLDQLLKAFRRQGANLDSANKAKLAKIEQKLSSEAQTFSENVLDATNAWDLIVTDANELKGLPESALDQSQQSAKEKGKTGWRFTLQAPSKTPIFLYAENESLRKTVWKASVKVGRQAPHDNTALIWKMLKHRDEKATLLSYKHYPEYILEERMAKGDTARKFVKDLHKRVVGYFNREVQALEAFRAATLHGPIEHLQPWDISYWAQKKRKAELDFDDEVLRPYFKVENVMAGLFDIAQTLFGLQFRERETFCETPKANAVPVWDAHVRYYDVMQDGKLVGSFYADWFPRENKRGGAWMSGLVLGRRDNGHREPHVGVICGNLTPSTPSKPSLLTHDEVETIFHEFGHLLHHLFSEVEIRSLGGTNVAWDFVELPSQLMENFCWERESLDRFAKHYQTGERIPDALFQKMRKNRTFLAGMTHMRQLALAKMDLDLHLYYKTFAQKGRGNIDPLIRTKLKGYEVTYKKMPPTILNQFGHLFGDSVGYSSGYYSYKWAEVLEADAFTRFQKDGILNPKVGRAWIDAVLSRGDSEDAVDLFKRFMGRDASVEPLLTRSFNQ
ncbi:MAG: hypothetical protein A2Y14_01280 [Verrucomicrobia bacterium GWF2_51_19]|nr:MAG: hypothetical protein A2Y14_01280 [Verrucomicrobia bacterium GWF2_51_19]